MTVSLPSRAITRTMIVDYVEEHPEWWVLIVSAGAWLLMLPHALVRGAPCHQLSFLTDWRNWILMIAAMMLPLMLQSVRWAAERSFRSRQGRAMGGYLVGYLAPWAVLGVGVALLLGQRWTHNPWLAPAVFVLAGAWSSTPLYTRLVGASHRTIPLTPNGWRANVDCMRLGVLQGVPCVASCAMLMLGCTLTGHGLVAMVGGAAIGANERLAWQPSRWTVPIGCAALALWYGAAAGHARV